MYKHERWRRTVNWHPFVGLAYTFVGSSGRLGWHARCLYRCLSLLCMGREPPLRSVKPADIRPVAVLAASGPNRWAMRFYVPIQLHTNLLHHSQRVYAPVKLSDIGRCVLQGRWPTRRASQGDGTSRVIAAEVPNRLASTAITKARPGLGWDRTYHLRRTACHAKLRGIVDAFSLWPTRLLVPP